MRNLIEELAVRLARQYPDQEELPARMLANVERIDREIPPGGMDVPLCYDATTETRHGLRVLWADLPALARLQCALERPDRPDLSDPQIGGPLARRLALEGFDEPAGRPDVGRRGGSGPSLTRSARKRQQRISAFGPGGRAMIVRPARGCGR
jgi:hypothetical protein